MDNPREMTIQDMIDEFGTETRVICNQCTINGTGGPLIYQAEVTGIPLNKIIETLGLHDDANMLDAIGVDGYDIPVYSQVAIDSDPLRRRRTDAERTDPGPRVSALHLDGRRHIGRFVHPLIFRKSR